MCSIEEEKEFLEDMNLLYGDVKDYSNVNDKHLDDSDNDIIDETEDESIQPFDDDDDDFLWIDE